MSLYLPSFATYQYKKMEDQCSPLTWAYCYQEEGIEELRHYLLYTILELEATTVSAHEELARKDDELIYLNGLLTKAIEERDEAQVKCQSLMLEKLILQQQLEKQQHHQQLAEPACFSGSTSNEDGPRGDSNAGFSSSDCEENITASPGIDPILQQPLPPALQQLTEKVVPKRPLPEKGKFLQAVMEAGPLLQTLLLAGPLPQWQHPPPQLNSIEIPPVTIPSPKPWIQHPESSPSPTVCVSRKRGLLHCDASDSSPKHQKVAHQSPLTTGYSSP